MVSGSVVLSTTSRIENPNVRTCITKKSLIIFSDPEVSNVGLGRTIWVQHDTGKRRLFEDYED